MTRQMHSEALVESIQKLKSNETGAANAIWRHCFAQLVAYADRRLGDTPRAAVDEEDIALCAMDSFFRGVKNDKFPQLRSSEDVWKILYTITDRTVKKRLRSMTALKRGGVHFWEYSFTDRNVDNRGFPSVFETTARNLDAETFTFESVELLEKLGDKVLRRIAVMKLYKYTNPEIAEELKYTVRSVERKIRVIRQLWKEAYGAIDSVAK